MSDCRLLVRPRLLELMAERWTRKVVCVVAGTGFGKSVLLAQAGRENRLAPRGVELTVAGPDRDRSPVSWLDRLSSRLQQAADTEVCVVVDDVDDLTATDDNARQLAGLVRATPPSVHFVLAGRSIPPGLAVLRAGGEVRDLGEDELAMCDAELDQLADLHGIDRAPLSISRGWPTVASVAAACGTDRARDHVVETLRGQVDDRQRRLLAVAAMIGPADRHLLEAAVGDGSVDDCELEELTRLPLVARRDGALVVHEVWHEEAGRAIARDERRAVVSRATIALADRGEFERSHLLCTEHQLWDDAARVLRAACARGYPEVRSEVLVSWLDALPADRWDGADGLLLRGLVGRMLDPFGAGTADVLERAIALHRASGDVIGEIAAINELAFVLRNQGRGSEVVALVARAVELRAAGHPGVDGLLAMARSVCAELGGDAAGMLDSLDAVPVEALSPEWRAAFAFRRTIGHLTTGDDQQMLEAATSCVRLAGDSTLRHALAMARWFAGDPQPALDALADVILDAERSQVDAVALGSFATMVLATTGRVAEAGQRLAITERAARGGPLVPMMGGYLCGNRALVAAAGGDDASACAILEAALAERPLTDPVGWIAATRWLPLAYVLVPATRPVIDAAELGPLHASRVAIAKALVAVRHGARIDGGSGPSFTAQEIATALPLPWSMELAAGQSAAGAPLGRQLAAWCMERSGAPARDALRSVAVHPDPIVRRGAVKLLAEIPLAPEAVRLEVLGPTALHLGANASPGADWQRSRVRSLLLFLALHGPARREAITDALWPGLEPTVADRNLRVTLAYLQRVLEPERRKGEAPFLVCQDGPSLVLAGAPHVSLDLFELEDLLDRAAEADRRGVPSVARQLLETAIARWRGPCLTEVQYEEWAQPAIQLATARYVAAAVRAAELALADGDTAAARRHARRALAVDEWSEPAHRVLIAAAAADGDRAGAARATTACRRMLTDLGVDPAA
ncbi:MAG: BTAD domain-containing putative transcriptional regulator [Ilumatobacteraceae bacterium]